MAFHAAWKGHLKLSLVSFPVQAFTTSAGTQTNEVSFNQLHESCHSLIRYKKTCPVHGEVPHSEIVSGYEFAKGQYVVIDKDELADVQIKGEKSIEVATFVPIGTIDPTFYTGQSYYLVPDGKGAAKTYDMIRRGLRDEGLAAIGEVVISRKQKLVAVRATDSLLVMDGLHYSGELREPEEFAPPAGEAKATAPELKLLKSLLEGMSQETFDPTPYQDDYNEKLRAVIDAKVEGKEVTVPAETKAPHVINLMDAIKKSLKLNAAPKAAKAKAGKPSRTKAAGSKRKSG